MNGFDPKSSNVSGQYQQQNQPQTADSAREINIGGKKARVSSPKQWLRKLISILFSPSKWGRSSRASTTSPIRHTPKPQDQPAKAPGTPIRERTVSAAEANDIASFINRPLPPTPDESSKPDVPPRSAQGSKPQPAPRTQKPETQNTKPAILPQPDSLEAFSNHFKQGNYTGSDKKTDQNVVKQHLRHFAKADLRPVNSNEAYKSLPPDSKRLVQEVYAEKKVTEDIGKLPTGSKEELGELRSKLSKAYKNETSDILVKEFDRQQFTAKCSSAYLAIDQTPHELQEEAIDFSFPKRPPTEEELEVKEHFNNQREKSPKLTNIFKKETPEGKAFISQAIPKYRDIPCDIESCAGSKEHYVHANYVRLSDNPAEIADIASQGPTEKNIDHFAHMINDTDSRVSVCLVSKNELDPEKLNQKKYTVSLGPKWVGEEKNYDGVTVKLADQYFVDNNKVRIDKLEVNGKAHFRVYDTGWEDHTSGTPSRLAALSVLVEQLKHEPELSGSENSPMVVNCNAGVGRTGTFITLSKSTRAYLQDGTVNNNLDPSLHKARETRKAFVQTAGQYNALKALHKQLPAVLNPLIEAAGLEIKNPPDQNATITEIDDTYANFEAVHPKSQAPARESGTVSTAKEFMQRFDSGHYNDQPDYWSAVQQDISTIYTPVELKTLTSNIRDFANSSPEYQEQADYMQSLVNTQLKSVAGPGR